MSDREEKSEEAEVIFFFELFDMLVLCKMF